MCVVTNLQTSLFQLSHCDSAQRRVAGQKVFNQRQMLLEYWTNPSAVVLVYDASNRDSFVALSQWLNDVRAIRSGASLPGVVVANKVDLRDANRLAVNREEGKKFADQEGFQFFEVSTMHNIGVEAPFNGLADRFYTEYVDTLKTVKENVL